MISGSYFLFFFFNQSFIPFSSYDGDFGWVMIGCGGVVRGGSAKSGLRVLVPSKEYRFSPSTSCHSEWWDYGLCCPKFLHGPGALGCYQKHKFPPMAKSRRRAKVALSRQHTVDASHARSPLWSRHRWRRWGILGRVGWVTVEREREGGNRPLTTTTLRGSLTK